MTPRAPPGAFSVCPFLRAWAASVFSPAAIADSMDLMKVRMRLIREWLMVSRLALRRMRFLACGVFAMKSPRVPSGQNEKAAQKAKRPRRRGRFLPDRAHSGHPNAEIGDNRR